MPKYKYLVTAEVEVEAYNVMIAEKAVQQAEGIGKLRVIGASYKSVKMPSQRGHLDFASIRIGKTKIKRMKNADGN